jgi:hypothetical protein
LTEHNTMPRTTKSDLLLEIPSFRNPLQQMHLLSIGES